MKTWEMFKLLDENPKLKFKTSDGYSLRTTDISNNMIVELRYKDKPTSINGNISLIDEWEEVRQPVDFMSAFNAWMSGKKISYELDGSKYTLYPHETHVKFYPREILHGIWYIED